MRAWAILGAVGCGGGASYPFGVTTVVLLAADQWMWPCSKSPPRPSVSAYSSERWHQAIASSSDPVEQFARCIDVHLRAAAMMGRLVFVLGGEASRQESPLHTRRMEVHDQLVEMLRAASPDIARLDSLMVRTTIFALEAITRQVLTDGDEGRKVTTAAVDRAPRVMVRLVSAGFAGSGDGVTPLPLEP
jgi:hypothetical protein